MEYQIINSGQNAKVVSKNDEGMFEITPDTVEINELFRLGIVGEKALRDFVRLQKQFSVRPSNGNPPPN